MDNRYQRSARLQTHEVSAVLSNLFNHLPFKTGPVGNVWGGGQWGDMLGPKAPGSLSDEHSSWFDTGQSSVEQPRPNFVLLTL